MKKRQKKTQALNVIVMSIFGLGIFFAAFGMSRTVAEIDAEVIAGEPEAVLARAGVTDGSNVELLVTYFDQKSDNCVNMYDLSARAELMVRQFEWTSCGYYNQQIEQGMVEYELGKDYLPVAVGGRLTSNRGLKDMNRWYNNVDGKSKGYTGVLKLDYNADEVVEFTFDESEFYPLDQAAFSEGDAVNADGHNHLFTMNFAMPFVVAADGNESFEIAADDDTFVYVGTKLAIDMGGIHGATTGRLAINEAGEVYTGVEGQELAYAGIQVTPGESSVVRVFHADRDANDSSMRLRLTGVNLNVTQGQMASTDGVQVAYDPTDPGYVAPLGESMVVRPDMTKGRILIVTILGVMIVACAVLMVISARAVVNGKKE